MGLPTHTVLSTAAKPVMVGLGGFTTSVWVTLVPEQPLASVARTVMEKLPLWVGVPDTTPLVDRFSPVGNVPLANEKLRGVTPPLAVNVWLKAVPCVAVVVVGTLIVMTAVLLVIP